MASANAARGLAAMFSLYLHRELSSVIILFGSSPKREYNAYSLVWQMEGITVEIEDSSYHSDPLLIDAFISVELTIMKRFFSILGNVFSDSM